MPSMPSICLGQSRKRAEPDWTQSPRKRLQQRPAHLCGDAVHVAAARNGKLSGGGHQLPRIQAGQLLRGCRALAHHCQVVQLCLQRSTCSAAGRCLVATARACLWARIVLQKSYCSIELARAEPRKGMPGDTNSCRLACDGGCKQLNPSVEGSCVNGHKQRICHTHPIGLPAVTCRAWMACSWRVQV